MSQLADLPRLKLSCGTGSDQDHYFSHASLTWSIPKGDTVLSDRLNKAVIAGLSSVEGGRLDTPSPHMHQKGADIWFKLGRKVPNGETEITKKMVSAIQALLRCLHDECGMEYTPTNINMVAGHQAQPYMLAALEAMGEVSRDDIPAWRQQLGYPPTSPNGFIVDRAREAMQEIAANR